MFPTGRPGIALLMLRIALCFTLWGSLTPRLAQLGSLWFLVGPAIAVLTICLGVFTPLAALLCIVLEASTFIALGGSIELVHVCVTLESIAIALLGPGAYSVDARLFGRRKIVFPDPADSNQSK